MASSDFEERKLVPLLASHGSLDIKQKQGNQLADEYRYNESAYLSDVALFTSCHRPPPLSFICSTVFRQRAGFCTVLKDAGIYEST